MYINIKETKDKENINELSDFKQNKQQLKGQICKF